MGVRNGAEYLTAQLHSIAQQTHTNWHLICSDDGSTDASGEVLRRFAQDHPNQVSIRPGPCCGFSENFMSLIRNLPAGAGYVSFADQDDIWLPDKLTRGLIELRKLRHGAALYCGRQSYWYPHSGHQLDSSPMTRPFTFRNALIENVASGNTILLNPAAACIAQQAACHTGSVFAHDWWLYLLITATGHAVHFDNKAPQILYRQHSCNAIGAGKGFMQQVQRKVGVLRGDFSQRVERNLHALLAVEDMLTPQAREACHRFLQARHKSTLSRLTALHHIAPYRQRVAGTIGFWGAASLGKV